MAQNESDNQLGRTDTCLLEYKDGCATVSTDDVPSILNDEWSFETIYRPTLFFLSGIVTIFSWTAIIAQTTYFETRMRNSLKPVIGPLLCVISMGSLLIGSCLNIGVLYRYKSKWKIITALVINIICFIIILIIILCEINDIFFLIILLLVDLAGNISQPIMMSACYEELRYYSDACISMYNGGIGSSSLISGSLLLILTPINLSQKSFAMVYTLIASFLIFINMVLYIQMTKTNFYQMSFEDPNSSNEETDTRSSAEKFKAMIRMFRRKWIDCVSLILGLGLTLFVYPIMILSIKSTSTNESWKKYFIAVVCFFSFGLGDTVGRYIYLITLWPKPGTKSILSFALFRFLTIFLLLLCNRPDKATQKIAFLMNDFFPFIITQCMALSNAHLITRALSATYTLDKDEDKVDCARTFVLSIDTGLTIGAMCSFLVPLF